MRNLVDTATSTGARPETAAGNAATSGAAPTAGAAAAAKPGPGAERYDRDFARLEARAVRDGDVMNWIAPVRRAAIARFRALGFPTSRNEDWRFTSVSTLAATDFALPEPAADGRGALPSSAAMTAFELAGVRGPRLVFVDGYYAPELSGTGSPDAAGANGVYIGSFRGATGAALDALRAELARHAGYESEPFTALNTAFIEDGALVVVPRGVVMEEPVHILSVTRTEGAGADGARAVTTGAGGLPPVTHGRVLVVCGDESQLDVIEDYVSLGAGVHFSNAVTEIVAGDAAIVTHTLIERENSAATNVSTLAIRQGRDANVTSHSLLIGGALVRNNVYPVLAGEGGECLINGLFMGKGSQHLDNYMRVEHVAPHCSSRQFYKGILDDRSHGVFHGRIVVHKGAQKTDAKQTNRNLLLSREAQIDTKPQLEIYADDVKCTHGATIGQVDEEAIFYLRSRGIAEAEARSLLLLAFANESLERMKDDGLRGALETLVKEWFA